MCVYALPCTRASTASVAGAVCVRPCETDVGKIGKEGTGEKVSGGRRRREGGVEEEWEGGKREERSEKVREGGRERWLVREGRHGVVIGCHGFPVLPTAQQPREIGIAYN